MQQPIGYTLRLALRSLSRARGMTVIAVLTLGGGLTAAVGLLGVADSGLRSLPVPQGGDVVELQVRNARAERTVPPGRVAEWAVGHGVLDAGALQQTRGTLRHAEYPARRASGAAMHASVLRLLRVAPALGRLPAGDEDASAILLGWSLFEELGADASLLGESVELDGTVLTVIGVMPPGFGFPENQSFWTVLPETESGEIVARLAPEVPAARAVEAVAARLDALSVATGQDGAPHRVAAPRWTMSREEDGGEGAVFAALGTLVLLLLVVCCANVATLLLVRGTERAGHLAVQSALGASRAQVTFQLFTESFVIALAGGVLGLAGGFLLLRWMQLELSSHWGYYWMAMEVRLPVLLATAALVLLTALAAGTWPALRAGRVNVAGLLVGSGRGRGDVRQRSLGRWFTGVQVTMSALGLIAAIYLAAEFSNVGRVTQRLPLDEVAVARLTLPDAANDDTATRADLVERLREELRRIPGVVLASVSNDVPGGASPVALLHTPDAAADAPPRRVAWVAADAAMVPAYRMRTVAGQMLAPDSPPNAVVVSEGVAARYYNGRALGERIRLGGVHGEDSWGEIVGIVEDWFPDQRGTPGERVIVPLTAAVGPSLYISLGSTGDAAAVLGHVREAVRRVDERVPVEELGTLRARMHWYLRMMKVIAGFGVLGGVASALVAAVGLYGVIAFQVRARRRELGIRMAIGAAPMRIAVEVVAESIRRVGPGLVVGIALAVATVPMLAVRTGQPIAGDALLRLAAVSGCAALALLFIGIVAGLEPALRAARVDPQEVLRAD